MKFKVLCTPLSGLVHMGCTLCQVFLWLHCIGKTNTEEKRSTKGVVIKKITEGLKLVSRTNLNLASKLKIPQLSP